MDYRDKYTRWHDKPNGDSNNGWVYTAVSKYMKPDSVDKDLLDFCMSRCSNTGFGINRNPDHKLPPMSIDEIYGMVSLGYLSIKYFERSHWNFSNIQGYQYTKPTLRSFITLYKIRNEHRNYFWEQGLESTYSLAFMVMPWFKYTIKKLSNTRPTIFETVMFYLNAISVIRGSDRSTRQLLWLQLKDLKSKYLIKFLPTKGVILDYYGKDHPFYKDNYEN